MCVVGRHGLEAEDVVILVWCRQLLREKVITEIPETPQARRFFQVTTSTSAMSHVAHIRSPAKL